MRFVQGEIRDALAAFESDGGDEASLAGLKESFSAKIAELER